jgi:hypothetical protein
MIVKRLLGITTLAVPLALAGAYAGAQQQQEPAAQDRQQTPVTKQSDMPETQHQKEVLKPGVKEEQRQTAPQNTGMPSTEHQREVLKDGEQPGQKNSQ